MKLTRLMLLVTLVHFAVLRGCWWWLLSIRPLQGSSVVVKWLWLLVQGLHMPFGIPEDDLPLRLPISSSFAASLIWGLVLSSAIFVAYRSFHRLFRAKA